MLRTSLAMSFSLLSFVPIDPAASTSAARSNRRAGE